MVFKHERPGENNQTKLVIIPDLSSIALCIWGNYLSCLNFSHTYYIVCVED